MFRSKNRRSRNLLIVAGLSVVWATFLPCIVVREKHLQVHLIDGTYELFRYFHAMPSARDARGREVGAVRGVLRSLLGMLTNGATHLAVATDHVIESFRNGLWAPYKTSHGIEPALLAQFPLLEEVLTAAGFVVWPMIEFEADDALASAAALAVRDKRVERVIICTPDKDLAQCVLGDRVIQFNRRKRTTMDETSVVVKFGVSPASIPDYLALTGDAADGYPGLSGWGARSTAAVLAKFKHLESIPRDASQWRVDILNTGSLARALAEEWEHALLSRDLATLRTNIPLFDNVDELCWTGPRPEFNAIGKQLDAAITDPSSKKIRRSADVASAKNPLAT